MKQDKSFFGVPDIAVPDTLAGPGAQTLTCTSTVLALHGDDVTA